MVKHMVKQNKLQVALYGLLVLLPLLWVLCILFCNGYKFDLSILVPAWNDEIGWHNQVSAVVEYGHPLGYYGYNGTHAQVGTWGAGGAAPLQPYAAFGKLLGWGFSSMALANIFFLCLALLLLIVLTKPSVGQTLWLIFLYSCSFITIGYSMTSMSEGLRYALAIVLTGGLIWMERHTKEPSQTTKKELVFYILFALFLLYAIQVYLVFVIVVPVWCWYLIRKRQLKDGSKKSLILSYMGRMTVIVIITGIVTIVSNKLVTRVCAPFVESTITTIFNEIVEKGLYQGICFFLDNFFQNLSTMDLFSIFSMSSDTYGVLSWFFINYLVLLFLLLFHLFSNRKQIQKDRSYCYEAAFFMTGFLIGYCALYTGMDWTLCRGINTGLLMAFIYLSFTEKERWKLLLLLITVFEITSIWGYYGSVIEERFDVSEHKEEIAHEKDVLADVIKEDDADPWKNTVAVYGDVDFRHLALPEGYGSNHMLDIGMVNTNAEYAVITCGEDAGVEDYLKNRLAKKGYQLIFEDSYFVVFQNREQSGYEE